MAAVVSSDLQKVLKNQKPHSVQVVIQPQAGKAGAVEQELQNRGIQYTKTQAGSLTIFDATLPSDYVGTLSQNSDVQSIDLNQTFSTQAAAGEVIKVEGSPANVNIVTLADTMKEIGIPEAWAATGHKGKGYKIGVIDTPVDESHPMLKDAIKASGGQTQPNDHGTWVAGACAGREVTVKSHNNAKIHGAAPEADLYVYGALEGGHGSVSTIAKGVSFMIQHNVDVVNMSFGGPHNNTMWSLMKELRKNDILPVVAAGNSGPNKDTMKCPGHHEDVLSVAAVGTNKKAAPYSSRGPGWQGLKSSPNVCAPGGDTQIVNGQQKPTEAILGPGKGGGYVKLIGTSMATPHVTGMSAFVR